VGVRDLQVVRGAAGRGAAIPLLPSGSTLFLSRVMTVTTTVSGDGKTRTTTFKGKNEKGQDVNNVAVYEKK
jgi:hypothetical protein